MARLRTWKGLAILVSVALVLALGVTAVPMTGMVEASPDTTIDVGYFSGSVSNLMAGHVKVHVPAAGTSTVIVDDTPPVTTCTPDPATPNRENGWYISDVTITLTATDDTSGVACTKYNVDGAGWTDYTAPFKATTDGEHTVQYHSVDKAGNTEETKSVIFGIVDAEANVEVSHRHVYFTDADSVDANVPLHWSHQWLLSIRNPTVDLTNPYITLTSDLPFVGFDPEPIVIGPSTVQWVTPYMPAGTNFPCNAIEGEDTFPPGFSLSKSVSPQKLVDEITLQTVTATYTLGEAVPDRDILNVHIGFLPCVSPAGLPDEAVTSVYHSGASDTGPWEFHGNPGDRTVYWFANPSDVEIGKTYQLTAIFETTRSPELLSAPIYKPRVSTLFCKDIPYPPVFGSSTTIDYDGVSVTFGADEEVTWNRGVTDLRRGIILEAVYLTDIKQEKTEPGEYIVDAKTEADTEVIKSGSGTPTVTIAKYSSNPGTHFSGDIGKHVDVHIDDEAGVDEIEIRLYYTDAEIAGLDESSLKMRYWDGNSWELCSHTGVDTGAVNTYSGYIWARITGDTMPKLSDLTGTPFAGGGSPPPPPPSPPGVPTVNHWGIVAMITLFAGLLVWTVRRRRLAS